jgi:MFS family permease
MFALLLVTALLAIPLWTRLSKRYSKRTAYIAGMSFWAVVQLLIFSIQPGQVTYILILAVLAGLSVSTAHVLPDAIFPDVIEWDELRTGRRQEGIYYGVKNFVRKLTGAIAIFVALQVLGWFGYQAPPEGATQFTQSPVTLTALAGERHCRSLVLPARPDTACTNSTTVEKAQRSSEKYLDCQAVLGCQHHPQPHQNQQDQYNLAENLWSNIAVKQRPTQ